MTLEEIKKDIEDSGINFKTFVVNHNLGLHEQFLNYITGEDESEPEDNHLHDVYIALKDKYKLKAVSTPDWNKKSDGCVKNVCEFIDYGIAFSFSFYYAPYEAADFSDTEFTQI